jgi:hypothetical protein
MPPVITRYSSASSSRKPCYAAAIRPATSEEARSFVFEKDASPEKYMHYYDQLEGDLDVTPPQTSEHQVKQDPTGTLKSTGLFTVCQLI